MTDAFTSQRTIKWIESLAEQERRIKAGERASIDLLMTKEEVLTEETSSFAGDLFRQFEALVTLFNERVNEPALQLTLQRVSDTLAGVALVRNGMRLQCLAARPGVLQILCQKWIPEEPHRPVVMFSGLVEAQFETFHDVQWYFLGSPITPEQLARHYLTEFIQVTRPTNES